MKILISAFAMCPNWGSEPGIAWNTVFELQQNHEVWVLCEVVWKERIESRINLSDYPNLHVVYVSIPWFHQLAEHWVNNGITWISYYYFWQFKALKVARPLHHSYSFDLVHHLTFGKVSIPSRLYQLPIPFIFGPVGGAEMAPTFEFFQSFSRKFTWIERFRLFQNLLGKWDPGLQACVSQSACAIGVTKESTAYLKELGARQTRTLPAISLLEEDWKLHPSNAVREDGEFKFLFVGRLLAWKGVDLALEAISVFLKSHPKTKLKLEILGDGPVRGQLQQLTETLNLNSAVQFKGNLPRPAVLDAFSHADALLFPSLHDSGGFVVIEAMTHCLPVICLDLGGPGGMVNESVGWKICAQSRGQTIHDLSDAIAECVNQPMLRSKKGLAGREHVMKHFTSRARAQQFEDLYRQILEETDLAAHTSDSNSRQ